MLVFFARVVRAYVWVFVCVCVCMNVACVNVLFMCFLYMCVYTYICVCIYIYMHIYTHIYIVYMYIYIVIIHMGTQNGHILPFLDSATLRKRKGKTVAGVKSTYYYLSIVEVIKIYSLMGEEEQDIGFVKIVS